MRVLDKDYPYQMTDKDGFMLKCDDMPYFQVYPRRTRNMFILFCISGSANITRDLKKFRFCQNMEWFVMCDSIIQIQNPTPDFKVRYCYFTPNLFDEVTMRMESAFFDFLADYAPYQYEKKEDAAFSDRIFGLIEMIYQDMTNIYRKRIAINILQTFFLDLYNKVHLHIPENQRIGYNSKDKLIKSFFGLIHRYYSEHRNVAYYADKLCVSTRYLSSVTNIISGCSPKKLIDDYIALEIRIQLQSTNYTIQEISQRLNFSDQSVMGRFFKQQTGMSAVEYRKSLI